MPGYGGRQLDNNYMGGTTEKIGGGHKRSFLATHTKILRVSNNRIPRIIMSADWEIAGRGGAAVVVRPAKSCNIDGFKLPGTVGKLYQGGYPPHSVITNSNLFSEIDPHGRFTVRTVESCPTDENMYPSLPKSTFQIVMEDAGNTTWEDALKTHCVPFLDVFWHMEALAYGLMIMEKHSIGHNDLMHHRNLMYNCLTGKLAIVDYDGIAVPCSPITLFMNRLYFRLVMHSAIAELKSRDTFAELERNAPYVNDFIDQLKEFLADAHTKFTSTEMYRAYTDILCDWAEHFLENPKLTQGTVKYKYVPRLQDIMTGDTDVILYVPKADITISYARVGDSTTISGGHFSAMPQKYGWERSPATTDLFYPLIGAIDTITGTFFVARNASAPALRGGSKKCATTKRKRKTKSSFASRSRSRSRSRAKLRRR